MRFSSDLCDRSDESAEITRSSAQICMNIYYHICISLTLSWIIWVFVLIHFGECFGVGQDDTFGLWAELLMSPSAPRRPSPLSPLRALRAEWLKQSGRWRQLESPRRRPRVMWHSRNKEMDRGRKDSRRAALEPEGEEEYSSSSGPQLNHRIFKEAQLEVVNIYS